MNIKRGYTFFWNIGAHSHCFDCHLQIPCTEFYEFYPFRFPWAKFGD